MSTLSAFNLRVIAREVVTPEIGREIIEGECVECRKNFRQFVEQKITRTESETSCTEKAVSSFSSKCPACFRADQHRPLFMLAVGILMGLELAILLGWKP